MIERQPITLDPGQSQLVSFTFIPQEARSYEVLVNGLIGSFVALPPYDVSVSFHREQRCAEWRAGGCVRYFPNVWLGELVVTNQGREGNLRTILDVWLYWGRGAERFHRTPETPDGELLGSPWEWQDYFAQGQSRAYRFDYVTPMTGMPLFVRHYIKVFDPEGNLIYEDIIDGGLFTHERRV